MNLYVDIGRIHGWAILLPGLAPYGGIQRCGFARRIDQLPHQAYFEMLMLEHPHGGDGKASRLDLVKMGQRMQEVKMSVSHGDYREIFPNKWKGQVAKDTMNRRVYERWMRPDEQELFLAQRFGTSVAHNVLDACGMAIWHAATLGWRELYQR